jgi:hypothetical protein
MCMTHHTGVRQAPEDDVTGSGFFDHPRPHAVTNARWPHPERGAG